MRWRLISLSAAMLCAAGSAQAQTTGFYLPTGVTSAGQDEFRAADGTTCRSTMDGTKRVEVGTFGSGGRSDSYDNSYYSVPTRDRTPASAGVYGRFTMSLDAAPSRIDCNRLYQLEMEKRELEVELMKRSLRAADHKLDELKAQPRADAAPASRPAKKPASNVHFARNTPPL